MKRQIFWTGVALALVLLLWVIDALVYGWFFQAGRHADVLRLRLSPYELFLHALTLILLLATTAAVAVFLTRRREHADAMRAARMLIQDREAQMQALNEQLTAANQQLTASLQQLDASNQQLRAEERELKAMNKELADSEKALLESRAHYRHMTTNMPGVVYQFQLFPDGRRAFPYVSPKCRTILKLAPETVRDHPEKVMAMIHAEDRAELERSIAASAAALTPWNWEGRLPMDDGEHWLHGISQPQRLEDGSILWDGIIIDVTDRKRALAALHESEERYRTLAETAPQMIFMVDADGRVLYVNAMSARQLKAAPDKIIGRRLDELFPANLAARHLAAIRQVIESGHNMTTEMVEKFPGGDLWIDVHLAPLRNDRGEIYAVLGLSHDITVRRQTEDRIRASLREKELMLKEIHHRVKNNLQVISSLLNLQAAHVIDARDLPLFTASQERVRAMALVHEKLYQSSDMSHINFHEYLRNMIAELNQTHPGAGIQTELEAEGVFLTIEKAIPCGLIAHELAGNAMRHAFPKDTAPAGRHLRLTFRENEHGAWRMAITDNGVGLPAEVDTNASRTLGLQLVNILTRQIKGRLLVRRENGTTFEITFPKD